MNKAPRPVVLAILDGVGIAPPSRGNAVSLAKTPNLDRFITTYFTTTLQASSEAVGLPYGEIGNSEVGHLNIGAGRIVYQDLPRINRAILDASFFNNPVFLEAKKHIKETKGDLHLIGLVSNGGVHSMLDHLFALLEFCKEQKIKRVFIHAILDGRDAPHNSGKGYIEKLEKTIIEQGVGRIATVSGRFWSMDRDSHWERIEKAYLAMTAGEAEVKAKSALEAIEQSYGQEVYDEEFKPTVIINKKGEADVIKDGDAAVFFNFRADRARQLTQSFICPEFDKFKRPRLIKKLFFITMTEYEKGLPVKIAYPPEKIECPLACVLSKADLRQLHIAETEKYAHVTFFLNGGKEEPWPKEERALIPSPRVSSYREVPEMSAEEITEKVVQEIKKDSFDFIVVNFANGDMVSHTGDLGASVKAVEVVDDCLSKIAEAVLKKEGVLVITADHGNAEEVLKLATGQIDKEHSTYPVPFILMGRQFEGQGQPSRDLSGLTPAGVLADVTPTILKIMGISQPAEMTGVPLI